MVTRKSAYALRALCRLARSPAGTRQLATDIAALESIPKRFLDSILRQLTRHGLLVSSRGRNGGYALRTPASAINVASVVRILDGSAFTFPCLAWQGARRCEECPGAGACAAELAFGRMGLAARGTLEALTLAELAARVGDGPCTETPGALAQPERKVGAPPNNTDARPHRYLLAR